MCDKAILLDSQNKQGKLIMTFGEDFLNQHWWDKEWLIPQFNDTRLLGDERVNECDLFMLLRGYGHREKIDILERSVENISRLEISTDKLISINGQTDHLLKCQHLFSKIKVLMEKRMKYIGKLIPEKKD